MNTSIKVCLLGISLTLSCIALPAQAASKYNADPADKRPFSSSVQAGNTLYVSGVLGLDPKTGKAPDDVKAEIKLVLDNFKNAVEGGGFKMDEVTSVQIFCTDLSMYDSFNEIYRTYFNGHFPARAFIGAGSLLRGVHFEVMGIAAK